MIGRLLCHFGHHRWTPARYITWRNPATGGRHSKGIECCARCNHIRTFQR